MTHTEWMRGKCWDMAIALHKATKLPLKGLYDDDGNCHHAFVMTVDGKGIDARGLQSIEQLKRGSAGQVVRDLSVKEIEEKWVGRKLSAQEINAAKSEISRNGAIKYAVQGLNKANDDSPSCDM